MCPRDGSRDIQIRVDLEMMFAAMSVETLWSCSLRTDYGSSPTPPTTPAPRRILAAAAAPSARASLYSLSRPSAPPVPPVCRLHWQSLCTASGPASSSRQRRAPRDADVPHGTLVDELEQHAHGAGSKLDVVVCSPRDARPDPDGSSRSCRLTFAMRR